MWRVCRRCCEIVPIGPATLANGTLETSSARSGGFKNGSRSRTHLKGPRTVTGAAAKAITRNFFCRRVTNPDLHNGKCFSIDFPSTLPFELSKPKFLEAKACNFLE